MGGSEDGMGDLDNAPIPPTGSEDMGMMGNTDAALMGNDDGQDISMDNGNGDDELMNVINNLSMEDKTAVLKYAKSMERDNDDADMPQDDENMMPMESAKSFKSLVNEVMNDIINDNGDEERVDKHLPKEYRKLKSPFKSPY
jgi:hypothetical protein